MAREVTRGLIEQINIPSRHPTSCPILLVALHKNGRTTPAIRAEIVSSTKSAGALTRDFVVSAAISPL